MLRLDARCPRCRSRRVPSASDQVDRAAVVEHVEPLAPVLRRRVQRERLVVERARREQRHDLLGELVRAVVVRAVRDRDRQPERLVVRAHDVVAAGLRRVVRRPRPVGRLLGEHLVRVEREIAVDLARRDVVEALDAGRRGRSQSAWVPSTLVRKNRPGSRTARLLCDSAAKFTTTSMRSRAAALDELEVADVALDEDDRGPRRRRGSRDCPRT